MPACFHCAPPIRKKKMKRRYIAELVTKVSLSGFLPAGYLQARIQKYQVTPAALKEAKSSRTFSRRWKSELMEKASGNIMGEINRVTLKSDEISYLVEIRGFFNF